MITRIEIDGFKSFRGFGLDISPFLVLLGQNASGKSNLFDAIQLLRRLVSMPSLYDGLSQSRGELGELFRRRGDGTIVEQMSFAAEVILEPTVADQFGAQLDISQTRLRYELEIVQREGEDGLIRPFVVRESAAPIRSSTDSWTQIHHVSRSFRGHYLRYRRQSPLLETASPDVDGRIWFQIAQEGRQGRKRMLPANAAEATVLSSITSATEFPTLYALRKEIESWRFLQLDPSSLRMPSSRHQRGDQLDPSGANLAQVLHRIEVTSPAGEDDPIQDIAAGMARIIRGFSGIAIEENDAKEQWEVYLTTRDEGRISARVASDGTLRVLALLAALYDPEYRGLICFEEPENGIYPQRLRVLIEYLRLLVTAPSEEIGPVPEPLSQLVISSHSPLLLYSVDRADIVITDWVTVPDRDVASRVTRVRRLVPGNLQSKLPFDAEGQVVSEQERMAYPAIHPDDVRELLEAG